MVYDINLNLRSSIENVNNLLDSININESSDIMGNISNIINSYIINYPNREIFGIHLYDYPHMVDIYSKAFRKIIPQNFIMFKFKNKILFIKEDILLPNFRVEYNEILI